MIEAEIEHRLTEVESRSKSNTKRLDTVEENQKILQDLATGVSVMGTKLDAVSTTVTKLDGKVEALESKPLKKYDALAEKIVWAIVAAAITFVLSHIGL